MEKINLENLDKLEKKLDNLLKNPKKNYYEINSIYQELLVYYFFLKSRDNNFEF